MESVQYKRYESNVPGSSLARIWLCGACTVEWMDPVTGEALSNIDLSGKGRDHAAALSLLKLLLCQPQRRAHRDWIMEQFWPENGRTAATHRLENVFSVLHKMACHPMTGESLLRSFRAGKENGMIYQLVDAPRLWLDVDALIWNVEQAARMDGLVMMLCHSGNVPIRLASVAYFCPMIDMLIGRPRGETRLRDIIDKPFMRSLVSIYLATVQREPLKRSFSCVRIGSSIQEMKMHYVS